MNSLLDEIEAEDDPGSATVIAIDPGVSTGWAIIQVHPDSLTDPEAPILGNVEYRAEGDIRGKLEIHQSLEIGELIDAWEGAAFLVEDFILREFSMARELLAPVRIKEHLTMYCQVMYEPTPRPMFLQQPSAAMSAVTDDRLRRWGLYNSHSGPHARDATRHAVHFLRRCKEDPILRSTAWPHIYGEADHVRRIGT